MQPYDPVSTRYLVEERLELGRIERPALDVRIDHHALRSELRGGPHHLLHPMVLKVVRKALTRWPRRVPVVENELGLELAGRLSRHGSDFLDVEAAADQEPFTGRDNVKDRIKPVNLRSHANV